MTQSIHPETIVSHSGYRSDSATNAVTVPIYQTASYEFESTEYAPDLFALKQLGNIYGRLMNPTCDVLEQRITALEGGAAALAVSPVKPRPSYLSKTSLAWATPSSAPPTCTAAPGIYSQTPLRRSVLKSTSLTRAIQKTFPEPPTHARVPISQRRCRTRN
jgi:hypothetical protein